MLTGVGVIAGIEPPHLRAANCAATTSASGAFEFNPARHDFGPKTLAGSHQRRQGFAEVEEAVDLLVQQPACARFVSRKLAVYFVGDDPPAALVERMAQTFQQSDGDIAAVLRTLFTRARIRRARRPQVQGSHAVRGVGGAPGLRHAAHQNIHPVTTG